MSCTLNLLHHMILITKQSFAHREYRANLWHQETISFVNATFPCASIWLNESHDLLSTKPVVESRGCNLKLVRVQCGEMVVPTWIRGLMFAMESSFRSNQEILCTVGIVLPGLRYSMATSRVIEAINDNACFCFEHVSTKCMPPFSRIRSWERGKKLYSEYLQPYVLIFLLDQLTIFQ